MDLATVILVLGVIGLAIASPGFRQLVFIGIAVCVLGVGWIVIGERIHSAEYAKKQAAAKAAHCAVRITPEKGKNFYADLIQESECKDIWEKTPPAPAQKPSTTIVPKTVRPTIERNAENADFNGWRR